MWGGKVVWWGSGVDTYLSRRSTPDWGPSHQHPHPPGYHRGRRRQREASDAAAGSGAEPQHPEKFAIFVIFCFRKNAKNFPKKFGRRPELPLVVAAGWVSPSPCLPPKLIKFRHRRDYRRYRLVTGGQNRNQDSW